MLFVPSTSRFGHSTSSRNSSLCQLNYKLGDQHSKCGLWGRQKILPCQESKITNKCNVSTPLSVCLWLLLCLSVYQSLSVPESLCISICLPISICLLIIYLYISLSPSSYTCICLSLYLNTSGYQPVFLYQSFVLYPCLLIHLSVH